jgi:RNA polymerase sigma-70 factor (ECF subfamily)
MPAEAARFCSVEYPRLVGGLALYTGDQYVAEELAQEALLRACQRWDQVRVMQSPGGWVWRVALNLANSHFRRRKVARRAGLRLLAAAPASHLDADGADAVAVRRAVAALPERQKTALVLRYFLDLPVDEAAARMGASGDAVRSLTKRALAALGSELAGSTSVAVVKEAEDV